MRSPRLIFANDRTVMIIAAFNHTTDFALQSHRFSMGVIVRHFDPWSLVSLAKEMLLVFSALGAGVFAWFKTRRAQSWLSTQGTLADVTSRNLGGLYKPWIVKFTYSYIVNGEYFSGFHRIRCQRAKRAESLASAWKGRPVVIRYSPSKHDVSALLWSDQPGTDGNLAQTHPADPGRIQMGIPRGVIFLRLSPLDTPPR